MTVAIASLLSILGVAVGAFLQNFFARQNNEAKQLLESRNQAYIDFLEAVSLVVSAQRLGKKNKRWNSLLGLHTQKHVYACLVQNQLSDSLLLSGRLEQPSKRSRKFIHLRVSF